jgi:muramoyltetrapeptide carboxypeptidase
MDALCPEPLRPGARVRVVAPSGRFDRTLVLCGMGFLAERYHVEFEPSLFERAGYLAGSDARRLGELDRALAEPGLAAVVAARGGYGLTRIAHRVEWSVLRRAPKWLVGFSDATVMHVEAARVGVASLHAHNVAGLGRGDAHARARWLRALEEPRACRRFTGLSAWRRGCARGPIAGGNLTMLFTTAAAGRLHVPDGAVLVLEDVTESSYRIDRMLSALAAGGHLDRVAAIVVGDLTDCPSGPHGVAAYDALRERLEQLRVPVAAGLSVGHGRYNEPLPMGLAAELDADRGTFTICP